MPAPSQSFSGILPPHWKRNVEEWIADDMPSFDIGGLVVGDKMEEAHLFGKSRGILAGIPFVDAVFEIMKCTVEWRAAERDFVDPSTSPNGKILIAIVRGPARNLLMGERTALNTLSRCSGVASAAFHASAVAREHGWHGQIAGTRKTTPGFRIVEKYGLLVGGAATHRLDLSNMVMLKDNHIWSAGSITNAVAVAKRAAGFTTKIEVECGSLEDATEASAAGADIVMLDNMEPAKLKTVAAALKAARPGLIIEASGGITALNMAEFFSPHVDVISQGALTQGYSCVDFSLKIQQNGFTPTPAKTPRKRAPKAAKVEASSSASSSAAAAVAPAGSPASAGSVVGSYRCIKGPAIAYRFAPNLTDRDEDMPPVPLHERVDGCVELAGEDGRQWLQVSPPDLDGELRFLPCYIEGEPVFEAITDAAPDVDLAPAAAPAAASPPAAAPAKPYVRPELHQNYSVFFTLTRPELKARNPLLLPKEISKELGKIWRALSDDEKRSYTLDKLKGPISLEDSADAKRGAEELGEAEDDESA